MDWIACSFNVGNRFLSVLLLLFCAGFVSETYGYDPLDPNGNITLRWDVMQENVVLVSMINYQLYRHIEFPGWKLSWRWQGNEVIQTMLGAEATEQGNCSMFRGNPPHCCEQEPTIVDLMPGAPYNMQVANCCKGGVLSSMLQDATKNVASFQMTLGSATDASVSNIPGNFTLGLAGYTCGDPILVPPTKFIVDPGRRRTQALQTWNVTCSYSQFRAASSPTCCVSLSAFYNDTIVPCQKCSCACQEQSESSCVKAGDLPPVLRLQPFEQPKTMTRCSIHMCPIQVHWHVKLSYKQYWRVKITLTNFNYYQNYSDWSLVIQHPNLSNITQVFSFLYKPLHQYGSINDSGMFYGIGGYNNMLLQAGKLGNVQTEMLMYKDPSSFTFREGWAFPRKVSFNGRECVMPSPDDYPRLPNSGKLEAWPSLVIIFVGFLLTMLSEYRF